MAKASELVARMAIVTGIEAVTLTRYARFAREGGYLSQYGRGTSAAHMKPEDVANMLCCILANDVAQEAPKQIERIKTMRVDSRSADHIDNRHLNPEQDAVLQELLPVVFDREHTLHEMLLALVNLSLKDTDRFVRRFGESAVYFTSRDYEAFVNFEISFLGSTLSHTGFSFHYDRGAQGNVLSEFYKQEITLTFEGIARISEVLTG